MRKKILAVVFLIIIVLECFVIYNKEKKVTTKDEIEEKEQINKENLITIIDILNDFEKNPSINLISIDDKVENYEVNIKIVGNKKEFIETISKLNNFKIVDYNIKLEENKPSVKELYLSFNNLDFYLKFTLFELLMFQLMTLRAKSD